MSLNNAKMNAWDAVSGSLAECIMTIEGKKYNFMQLIDFEATIEKTKKEIPILGRTGKGHKTTAWEGKFKGQTITIFSYLWQFPLFPGKSCRYSNYRRGCAK